VGPDVDELGVCFVVNLNVVIDVDVAVLIDVDTGEVEIDVSFDVICSINFILKLSKPMYNDAPLKPFSNSIVTFV